MPKMLNIQPKEFGIDDFRLLLDLVVLSNGLADKLSKTKDYDSLFGGQLKVSARNFSTKLETALKKVMEDSDLFSREHEDLFRNIENALQSFLDMSIEGRLAQQIDYEELNKLADKYEEKSA